MVTQKSTAPVRPDSPVQAMLRHRIAAKKSGRSPERTFDTAPPPDVAGAIAILDILLSKSIPENPEVRDLDSYRRLAVRLAIQVRGLLRGDSVFPSELSSEDLARFATVRS